MDYLSTFLQIHICFIYYHLMEKLKINLGSWNSIHEFSKYGSSDLTSESELKEFLYCS